MITSDGQKSFKAKQAIAGLLVSLSAVFVLVAAFSHLPADFWSAAGILIWLGLIGSFALSILQLAREADPRT